MSNNKIATEEQAFKIKNPNDSYTGDSSKCCTFSKAIEFGLQIIDGGHVYQDNQLVRLDELTISDYIIKYLAINIYLSGTAYSKLYGKTIKYLPPDITVDNSDVDFSYVVNDSNFEINTTELVGYPDADYCLIGTSKLPFGGTAGEDISDSIFANNIGISADGTSFNEILKNNDAFKSTSIAILNQDCYNNSYLDMVPINNTSSDSSIHYGVKDDVNNAVIYKDSSNIDYIFVYPRGEKDIAQIGILIRDWNIGDGLTASSNTISSNGGNVTFTAITEKELADITIEPLNDTRWFCTEPNVTDLAQIEYNKYQGSYTIPKNTYVNDLTLNFGLYSSNLLAETSITMSGVSITPSIIANQNCRGYVYTLDDGVLNIAIGASVTIKGNSSIGGLTDFDGYYNFTVNSSNYNTIKVSLIGYKDFETKFRTTSEMPGIILYPDTENIKLKEN